MSDVNHERLQAQTELATIITGLELADVLPRADAFESDRVMRAGHHLITSALLGETYDRPGPRAVYFSPSDASKVHERAQLPGRDRMLSIFYDRLTQADVNPSDADRITDVVARSAVQDMIFSLDYIPEDQDVAGVIRRPKSISMDFDRFLRGVNGVVGEEMVTRKVNKAVTADRHSRAHQANRSAQYRPSRRQPTLHPHALRPRR